MCNEFAQERAWRAYCEMMAREALEIVSDEATTLPSGSVRPSEHAASSRASRHSAQSPGSLEQGSHSPPLT